MATDDLSMTPATPVQRVLQAPNAWRVLVLLFLVNMFNFYDRTIPAIVTEPLKAEFSLSDLDIGILGGAFTVVYALVGIPLGRFADRASRKHIMGWGLVGWSALTAATGAAWNYASLLVIRLGVGVGEASYAPAANSTIADLFPAAKRGRAIGLFQLGLPVGLILAYFTVGAIAEAFDSWRAPFFIAAVPGIMLAVALFLIREPRRGAAEAVVVSEQKVDRAFARILSIPTVWLLIVAGIGSNFASYSVNTFMVPLFIRYFGTSLTVGSVLTGVVVGVTGLIGLIVGGVLSDRANRRSPQARVLVGAVALLLAAPLAFVALRLGPDATGMFVLVFSLSWLLQYLYYTSAYPALSDVVQPQLRATAVAIFFAAFYLLGGALGPVIAGALSDRFAAASDAATPEAAAAIGLHDSLAVIVPIALLLTAVGLFAASRTVGRDSAKMLAGLEQDAPVSGR